MMMNSDDNVCLREIRASDLEKIVALFKDTIHHVNAKDYTSAQLLVWAPYHIHHSHERWQNLLDNTAYLAEMNGVIVGFADITKEGYLDRLFVHKDYQRQGIASMLVKKLESLMVERRINKITTESSITAKPFFAKMGYQVLKEQQKVYTGVTLTNYQMEKILANNNLTPYSDINAVLEQLINGMTQILGGNLIGLYLFGSLVHGDFNENSSDIDLTAIVKAKLNVKELNGLKKLHHSVVLQHRKWGRRIECSYTPSYMLIQIEPPLEPRTYYNEGFFYEAAEYGNEWIINNYLLMHHSIVLCGQDFKTLMQPLGIKDVQKACIRDLFQEWAPKIHDFAWLDNSYYQSYLVVNLCRILYTVSCGKMATKKMSAAWVKNQYPKWSKLIEVAEQWEYGKTMALRSETIGFAQFIIDKIKHTTTFQQIAAELDGDIHTL